MKTTIEIEDFIKEHKTATYLVTFIDGRTEKKRLFYHSNYGVCEFNRRSRSLGHLFGLSDVCDIDLPTKKSDIENLRHNLRRVEKYLTNSGLWASKLARVAEYLAMTDDELQNEYNNQFENSPFGLDSMLAMCENKAIKTANYYKYAHFTKERVKEAIANKGDFQDFWEKGYDNRIALETGKDGEYRGWYSEEYRGCGNGHYYFLLDETHVLFIEND